MPVIYDAPAATPILAGLYQAATVHDNVQVRGDGILVRSPNCDTGGGVWDLACDPPPLNPDKTPATRHADTPFAAFGVWESDECGPRSAAETIARVQQQLLLHEQPRVEERVAARLLADAGTPVTFTAVAEIPVFVAAVGALEQALGVAPGVIHAPARYQAAAEHFGMVRNGRTPRGHAWAFGTGYDSLGAVLVGTGPVIVERSSVTAPDVTDIRSNRHVAVAERLIVVGWECTPVAVALT